MSKQNYVLYYQNLMFYLDNGMRLSKVHRVIGYTQTRWMEPYIYMNTRMRAAAKKEMEKDFHKLRNNAVYGKTCENQRKKTDIHIVKDRVQAAKLVDKPHCLDARIFNKKLLGIEILKAKLLLTMVSNVGFVIVESRKHKMLKDAIPIYHHTIPITLTYFSWIIHQHLSNEIIIVLNRFHYDIIKARYGE